MFGISKSNHCGVLPFVDNFVAWEGQIIMLKNYIVSEPDMRSRD